MNYYGGIWCLWNQINIDVTIIAKQSRAIHYHVVDNTNSKQFILTATYAPAQDRDKDAFWHHLKQLNESINLLWCIIGDFNELLQSSDKVRGATMTIARTQRLNDFLDHAKSIDAHVQGRVFTWKFFFARATCIRKTG